MEDTLFEHVDELLREQSRGIASVTTCVLDSMEAVDVLIDEIEALSDLNIAATLSVEKRQLLLYAMRELQTTLQARGSALKVLRSILGQEEEGL